VGTRPRGGHPCLKLTATATLVVWDLHPIDSAHAGRKQSTLPCHPILHGRPTHFHSVPTARSASA
jgi:hypothetical protein